MQTIPNLKEIILEVQRQLPEGCRADLIIHAPDNDSPVTIPVKSGVETSRIMDAVCSITGVPLDRILSHSRRREYVDARRIFVYLACIETRLSLSTLGGMLGRDHTTIINLRETASDFIKTDDIFKNQVENVKKLLSHATAA